MLHDYIILGVLLYSPCVEKFNVPLSPGPHSCIRHFIVTNFHNYLSRFWNVLTQQRGLFGFSYPVSLPRKQDSLIDKKIVGLKK